MSNFKNLKSKFTTNSLIIGGIIGVFCVLFALTLLLSLFSTVVVQLSNTPCIALQNTNVLNENLALYFKFNREEKYGENNTLICDYSGNNNHGHVYGTKWYSNAGVNNTGAYVFNEMYDLIQIKDSPLLSPSTHNGQLTVSFYVKFTNTKFNGKEKNYINYIGKGSSENGYEWTFRQYNESNSENRNNRLSFYTFNKTGGLGAGSYVQENITTNEWTYITGVINGTHIKFYKNGVLKSVNPLTEYGIKLEHTNSNLYIGNLEPRTQFNGVIDELKIYKKALTDTEVKTAYYATRVAK